MKKQVYERVGIYTLEEVLPFVVYGISRGNLRRQHIRLTKQQLHTKIIKTYHGRKIKMNSQRYKLFAQKGVKCVTCGIEGSFFAMEKPISQEADTYHFNLYAYNKYGDEVLMTKDHIIPRSKGGQDILNNYQTMCTICNSEKGAG